MNMSFHNEKCKNMSLREVMEYTKNIPIREGGIEIFMEKIVSEIEKLQILKSEKNV